MYRNPSNRHPSQAELTALKDVMNGTVIGPRDDKKDDKDKKELDWIVEFPFIPWRGAYPIGLTHMIGGLSAAATGALPQPFHVRGSSARNRSTDACPAFPSAPPNRPERLRGVCPDQLG